MWFDRGAWGGSIGKAVALAASLGAALFLVALLSREAWPRMHHPARGHRILPGGAPPLDGFTQPAGAYSLRRLRSAYTGPAIRLRRVSDNAELDINFLGFVPGLGAPLDIAAANAHCTSTTCTVRTWYEQSGNARDFVQTTAANQPNYVASCTPNGLPCVRFASSNAAIMTIAPAVFQPTSALQTISVVANRIGVGGCVMFRSMAASTRMSSQGASAALWDFNGASGFISAPAALNTWHVATGVANGASSSHTIDGTVTTGTVTGGLVNGSWDTSNSATSCDKTELVYWDAYAMPAATVTVLQADQRSFWGF